MTLKETINTLKISAIAIPTADRAVRVTGTDAKSWLQGQISQDMRELSESHSIIGCLCNPKGHIQTILHLYQTGSELITITPHPEILLHRIEEFVIMEDVSASLIQEPVSSIQGATATGHFARNRYGHGGFDTIEISNQSHIPTVQSDALEIAAGIPRFGIEIGNKTLPPELGPAFEQTTISYTKGCYVGQEVIHRIHSRGHTNKTWVGLIANQPFIQTTVTHNGIDVGTIHRSAEHPDFGFIASATLKNVAIAPGTQVEIGDVTATVKQMPLLG
ncbi:MAG: YgfZ/GcvT domain-containing protein [Fimbriimonadaceae bacterium]